jgi:hypothetical protein
MKIINSIFEKLVKTTYAQSIPNDIGPICYDPMYIPLNPLEQFILLIQESTVLKIISFVLAPLSAILLSVRNANNLLKRSSFSVLYSIYKSFLRVIILSCVFIVVVSLILFVFLKIGFSLQLLLIVFEVQFLMICVATGIGYLFFLFKSKKFLGLSFAYLFVVPSILIFLLFLILDIIPALNKYLPQDVLDFKKEQLRKRLSKEGKLPEDSNSNL